MLCWGSWANTQKLSGKWRFELFYLDYAFGVLLCAIIVAFTFGSLNSHEIGMMDTLLLTSKRKMLWALSGGVVFNLANMLLVAAIAVAGMSVAFPIGIGLALVIGVVWNYFLSPQGSPALLFGGAGLVTAAIVVDAMAYRAYASWKTKTAAPAPKQLPRGVRERKPSNSPVKGIVLSLISGVLMGSFYPLVQIARAGEDGVQPYADATIFSVGVFFSTFLFVFFFMIMPVQGESVALPDYFQGTKKQHALGVLGGGIWCAGAISNFLASSAPHTAQVGPAVSYALGQGATMVSALWGLLVWKEFAGAQSRVRQLLGVMLILFAAGLLLVAIAPLYGD
jgi:glucose uptake protein